MRPLQTQRNLMVSGSLAEGKFGISEKDQAHILGILRNTLYTNKILAVLREYGSNAWDAHREVGKGDIPIKVILPTELDAALIIRDQGPGLSEEDVFNVYTRYGASTKRDTNDAVGFLGIGCKSAFAYADTFTITSWHEGWKNVYVAVLDQTDVGVVDKMHEEPCDPEKTGVEIKVPVNPKDVQAFAREAEPLFRYFDPRPDINLRFKEENITRYKAGFITPFERYRSESVTWVAVMGCVPYKLSFRQLWDDLDEQVQAVLKSRSGGLFFEIGEVNVSANREELEYTDATLETIKAKINSLFTEVLSEAISEVDAAPDGWHKRLAVQRVFTETGIPLPDGHPLAPYRGKSATVYDPRVEFLKDADRRKKGIAPMPKHFRLFRDTSSSPSTTKMVEHPAVALAEKHYMVIQDTRGAVRRYLGTYDTERVWFARMMKGSTVEQVKSELQRRLKKIHMDGIEIKLLSEIPMRKTPDNKPLPLPGNNRKHNHKVFTLKVERGSELGDWPLSNNWATTEHQPEEGDLYVILDRFDAVGISSFFDAVRSDMAMLKMFGEELPPIYGVKTSDKSPVTHEDVEGTRYDEWRKTIFQTLLAKNPRLQRNLVRFQWTQVGYSNECGKEVLKHLRPVLDRHHPIIRFFSRAMDSAAKPPVARLQRRSYGTTDEWRQYERLLDRVKVPCTANAELEALGKRYPLLNGANTGSPGFDVFRSCDRYHPDDLKPWIDYILYTDERNPLP